MKNEFGICARGAGIRPVRPNQHTINDVNLESMKPCHNGTGDNNQPDGLCILELAWFGDDSTTASGSLLEPCFLHFCHFCGHRLARKNLLFLGHWSARDGLLEVVVRVVASSDVGNMGRRVAVAGKGHPLSQRDAGIVGNIANSELAPAVVLVEVGVFDPSFFVEFPAELKRTAEGLLDNKKIDRKNTSSLLVLCQPSFSRSCVLGWSETQHSREDNCTGEGGRGWPCSSRQIPGRGGESHVATRRGRTGLKDR
jgi:hypothetical protein